MENKVYPVRKITNIAMVSGSGFPPLSDINSTTISFVAEKNEKNVSLFLYLSINKHQEYVNFVENVESFDYLSFYDIEGLLTRDLFISLRTVTGIHLKEISFKLVMILDNENKQYELPVDLIYKDELFICRRGFLPEILKDK